MSILPVMKDNGKGLDTTVTCEECGRVGLGYVLKVGNTERVRLCSDDIIALAREIDFGWGPLTPERMGL